MSISNRRKIVFASLTAVLGVQLILSLFFWDGPAIDALKFFAITYFHVGALVAGCFAAYAILVMILQSIGYYDQDEQAQHNRRKP